jgi:hypothetical protein
VAYFSAKQNRLERGCKIAADVASAGLLFTFAIVYFGFLGGLVSFAILETGLILSTTLSPAKATWQA